MSEDTWTEELTAKPAVDVLPNESTAFGRLLQKSDDRLFKCTNFLGKRLEIVDEGERVFQMTNQLDNFCIGLENVCNQLNNNRVEPLNRLHIVNYTYLQET